VPLTFTHQEPPEPGLRPWNAYLIDFAYADSKIDLCGVVDTGDWVGKSVRVYTMKTGAVIISADELKQSIPGYNPQESHLVHRESARLADKQYGEVLRTSPYKEVVLMSGGSASGKTEFISKYLVQEPIIILDGTLPSYEGAKIKIKTAHKHGKQMRIIAIWPENLKVAFSAFLQRDRKFPDKHFYKTHSRSRKTLLEIAESPLDADIEVYEVVYAKNHLLFYQYIFNSRAHLIDELRDGQYNEKQIINLVGSNE
jgi:hypothetical protein